MKKLSKVLSTVLVIGTLSTQAFSQNSHIKDPNNILGQLDSFVAARTFSDEFKVFDFVDLEEKQCTIYNDGSGNDSIMECESSIDTKEIKEVNADYALLQDNLAVLKFTYEKYDRNPVRFWLSKNQSKLSSSLTSMGLVDKSSNQSEISIESITFGEYDINGKHDAAKVEFLVTIVGDDGSVFEFPFYIVVTKDLPFLGQITEFGFDLEIDGHKLPPVLKVTDYSKR